MESTKKTGTSKSTNKAHAHLKSHIYVSRAFNCISGKVLSFLNGSHWGFLCHILHLCISLSKDYASLRRNDTIKAFNVEGRSDNKEHLPQDFINFSVWTSICKTLPFPYTFLLALFISCRLFCTHYSDLSQFYLSNNIWIAIHFSWCTLTCRYS